VSGVFAQKLKSIPDGDGTLLDHSLILYGTTWATPTSTCTTMCRTCCWARLRANCRAGGICVPFAHHHDGNLLLSILDFYGIHQDSIGDSNGV